MKSPTLLKLLLTSLAALAIISCTKSGSEDSGSSDTPAPSNGGSNSGPQARTNCGVVKNGKIINPVSDKDGEAVRIEQVADSNAFIVTTASGKILVKLHGISAEPSSLKQNAINFLDRYTGKTVLFIRASDSCTATISGGGNAQVGQLITSTGESIQESLIRTGFVNASAGDGCSSELITSCLTALFESDPETAGELTAFLWKPQADSDGKLAVHTGPFDTTVTVNGEVGRNQGGGNGFGSLARFNKAGCSYGNARVLVRSHSGFAFTVGGQTTFSIPNGCGRYCLESGRIVACSK